MPKGPNDTDPTGSASIDVTDPDPKPVDSYEPPTDNERVRFIFENMETRRAPAPVDVPVTNGDFSASYSASHSAPARNPTPTEQPPVVVEADEPQPPPTTPSPPRRRNEPTVRILREAPEPIEPALPGVNRRWLVVVGVVGAAALLLIAAIAVSFIKTPPSGAAASTVPLTLPSAPSSVPRPSPPSVTSSVDPGPAPSAPLAPSASVPAAPAPAPLPSATPRTKVSAPARPTPKPVPSGDDFNLME